MKHHVKHRYTISLLLIAALIGWLTVRNLLTIAHRKQESLVTRNTPQAHSKKPRARPIPNAINHLPDGSTVELFGSLNPNEVIIRFPSRVTYQTFLTKLAPGNIVVVSQLDRLHAIRLGFEKIEDLERLFQSENISIAPSLTEFPEPRPADGTTQGELLGFGDTLLEWLEIHSDHSAWGAGVKIAVLDSGIVPHENLPGLVKSLAITPFPENLDKTHDHGTAVASLIAGASDKAPGLAPSSQLISIRISNDTGKTDCFALAAGILAAVDEGVDLINISMGTAGDNPLIRDAVIYAQEKQIVIVAASGNSGTIDAKFPAAYPGVISVGAVDANGSHLYFSDFGELLVLTAPGLALNTASPGNRYQRVSGTSASAAIVTGAIAATMSKGKGRTMTASQAVEILINHAHDAGIPGPDTQYGFGILRMR